MPSPWDKWVPGVLNKNQMKELLDGGFITSSSEPELDHSSMDLALSAEGFQMTHGSMKPSTNASERPYDWFITQKTKLARKLDKTESDGSIKLTKRSTYVFRLQQKLGQKLRGAGIYGQATAKSSVGRVDVLARLIVDGMGTYESFDPGWVDRGSGDMYLEITPITFDVRVMPGTSLSQLRLFYGDPNKVVIESNELYRTIFPHSTNTDGSLTADLDDTTIGDPEEGHSCAGSAFCASSTSGTDSIPLWKSDQRPDPCRYWKFSQADEFHRLYIESDNFYLLRSKEKLCVPSGVAIYCRASDETIGEMRIHYAGFVHPHFGLYRQDGNQGTPLMFEVRGHQVQVSLADKEKMANLIFYRMSQDAPVPDKREIENDEYANQQLKLSKFFDNWPKKVKRSEDGTIQKID